TNDLSVYKFARQKAQTIDGDLNLDDITGILKRFQEDLNLKSNQNEQQSQEEPQDLEAREVLEGSQDIQCNNKAHSRLFNFAYPKNKLGHKNKCRDMYFEAYSTVLRARSSFFREILCTPIYCYQIGFKGSN
ncbi:1658_t:CDS:2, partial [Racocetra fulgida]